MHNSAYLERPGPTLCSVLPYEGHTTPRGAMGKGYHSYHGTTEGGQWVKGWHDRGAMGKGCHSYH